MGSGVPSVGTRAAPAPVPTPGLSCPSGRAPRLSHCPGTSVPAVVLSQHPGTPVPAGERFCPNTRVLLSQRPDIPRAAGGALPPGTHRAPGAPLGRPAGRGNRALHSSGAGCARSDTLVPAECGGALPGRATRRTPTGPMVARASEREVPRGGLLTSSKAGCLTGCKRAPRGEAAHMFGGFLLGRAVKPPNIAMFGGLDQLPYRKVPNIREPSRFPSLLRVPGAFEALLLAEGSGSLRSSPPC